MNYTVIITLTINPVLYEDAPDTPEGAIQLANEMLNGACELPIIDDKSGIGAVIECDGIRKLFEQI